MSPIVIYHAGCFDGHCAAWLFSKAFPDATFHPAHYGSEPPDVAERDVYVADFSYKRGVMLLLAGKAKSLTVLDHHKSAAADLDGFAAECERGYGLPRPTVVFDMGKSGGRLAWEYLYDRHVDSLAGFGRWVVGRDYYRDRAPWLVDYTEDRDLWRWALSASREVNAALRSYPATFAEWDRLEQVDPESLVAEGRAIRRTEQQVVDAHVRFAREVEIGGHKVLCVNATTLSSEIAGELAAGRPFGACWFQRSDGKAVYSLRSRDGGMDVSEVARLYGGGGHRGAAGFEADAVLA